MDKECRECGLPVQEYKQVLQQEEDLCESCMLVTIGEIEFPSEENE